MRKMIQRKKGSDFAGRNHVTLGFDQTRLALNNVDTLIQGRLEHLGFEERNFSIASVRKDLLNE